ncbi:hypothetical protein [Sphingomonas sp. PAMC 26605]|uniref:hypothetical protein n=1 Tax=Sphingomonas sp. PAMC 26605 TaxID=1112214 RepID=UPI00026CDD42|nr:hypothetical protein [Sphingomonas sp. PAMC 26605]
MTIATPRPLRDAPELAAILAFLGDVGIATLARPLPGDTVLPGMTVVGGTLCYDPARAGWVGDLLHEAGHIAVGDPHTRAAQTAVADDPAEEMAAICWSYAAAFAIGLPVTTLFHSGYRDSPDYLIDAFARGHAIGLPMLRYWGLARRADEPGPPYPVLRRWLRR